MLIGICGGTCAGKHAVANYLVKEHGFKQLHLRERVTPIPITKNSAAEAGLSLAHSNDGELSNTTFAGVDAVLDFVTKQWRQPWVIADIWDESTLDVFLVRPFFLLVSVEAPVNVRWQRFRARCLAGAVTPPTLETFVLRNDEQLYNPRNGLAHLIGRAQLRLLNPSESLMDLHESLRSSDLTNEQRLRPSWDQYFMQLASLAAQRSNCMKRRVGCVLVREKRVISTGYNGTPRNLTNCNEGGCPRCNRGEGGGSSLSTCLCIHAEENALLEAGRDRIREGAILYCDTCPCLTCSVKITQVGICEVVYSQGYRMDQQTVEVFREAGVRLRQFSPPRNGLIDLGLEKLLLDSHLDKP